MELSLDKHNTWHFEEHPPAPGGLTLKVAFPISVLGAEEVAPISSVCIVV